MTERKKITPGSMIALALGAFTGIAAERVVVLIELLGFHMDYLGGDYTGFIIHWTVVCVLWGVWAYFIYFYSREGLDFDILDVGTRPKRNHVMLSLYIFVITITLSSAVNSWHMKPVAELFHIMDIYGGDWIAAFAAVNIGYLLECVLMCFILCFGQKAGDLLTGRTNLPWGGFFLSLTWGVLKVLLLGPVKGIAFMVLAVCYGLGFLLMQKNIKYAYPIVLLMYLF